MVRFIWSDHVPNLAHYTRTALYIWSDLLPIRILHTRVTQGKRAYTQPYRHSMAESEESTDEGTSGSSSAVDSRNVCKLLPTMILYIIFDIASS